MGGWNLILSRHLVGQHQHRRASGQLQPVLSVAHGQSAQAQGIGQAQQCLGTCVGKQHAAVGAEYEHRARKAIQPGGQCFGLRQAARRAGLCVQAAT